jgi:hypothetical protein
MNENSKYPTRIALGWLTIMILLLVSLVTTIVFSAFDNDSFTLLRRDPGRIGLRQMSYLVSIYALMPMLAYAIDRTRFAAARWLLVAFASANCFYLLLHHLSHWQLGERPTFGSHVVDLAISAVGLWLIYNSVRWARAASAQHGDQG